MKNWKVALSIKAHGGPGEWEENRCEERRIKVLLSHIKKPRTPPTRHGAPASKPKIEKKDGSNPKPAASTGSLIYQQLLWTPLQNAHQEGSEAGLACAQVWGGCKQSMHRGKMQPQCWQTVSADQNNEGQSLKRLAHIVHNYSISLVSYRLALSLC